MPARLSTYRAKRDPDKTPEPMGSRRKAAKPSEPIFVIQEHHARALHWDFRLERDGVLVSWALPKGLPEDPKQNHLAVHVEDHPLDYQSFEGDIPHGEYGGGKVSIWDHGTYETEKWLDDEVMVVLNGTRAKGRYVLFPTGKPDQKNWMIHRMDPPPAGFEPMPEKIRPMLAEPGELPRQNVGWAYEFKWDGVRAIVYVEGGRVRILNRNDRDVTTTFPELRAIGPFLGSTTAVLDGEIVAFDEAGRPDFGTLQHRLHVTSPTEVTRRSHDHPVNFIAFDLLYLNGHPTVDLTYDERRKLLEALAFAGPSFVTSPSVTGANGKELLALSVERGFEGLVVKARRSRYTPGQRSREWLKVKNFKTQEAVIGGWTDGQGERTGSLGALLLGIPDKGGLVYAGKVGTGFSESARRELLSQLQPLATPKSPFVARLASRELAHAHFVAPKLVGEVRYGEWTRDGRLRHPSWRGLRSDKKPSEVVRES